MLCVAGPRNESCEVLHGEDTPAPEHKLGDCCSVATAKFPKKV